MTAVPIETRSAFRREPDHRRTHAKVRRNSKIRTRNWHGFFSWTQGRRLLLALKIHIRTLRKKGQRTGAAGTISFGAVRLAELLVGLAVRFRGRLEPPVEYLAGELNVPEKSIHAWKAQLKAHGFLDWQRRYVETGRQGVRGPQVAQTTNAYFLACPPAAEAALERKMGPRGAAGDKMDRARRISPELTQALDNLCNAVQDDADQGAKPQTPT